MAASVLFPDVKAAGFENRSHLGHFFGRFKGFGQKSWASSDFRLGIFEKVGPMLCRRNSNFPTGSAEIILSYGRNRIIFPW